MSELKGQKPSNFEEVDIDINSIPYKDKLKEQSRKRKLEEFKATGVWPQKDKRRKMMKSGPSWSIAKEKRAKKQLRKSKKNSKAGNGLSAAEISSMEKAFDSNKP